MSGTNHDRRLGQLLETAAGVICRQGYDAASMRDIARATGASLAGLYHYFPSKERLLYLIQKDAFETLLARAQARLAQEEGPEPRLHALIENHVEYFLQQPERSKVLSHEDETLQGPLGAEIAALKRSYYRLAAGVVNAVLPDKKNARVAVLSLFGMMNWMYTWHNPKRDPGANAISAQMAGIFLHGVKKGHSWKSKSASRT